MYWKAYEAILVFLQEFWIKERTRRMQVDEGYMNYVCFLAATKNRLIEWKEKEKFRAASAPYLIQKLKEVKKVRNRYSREQIVYNTH